MNNFKIEYNSRLTTTGLYNMLYNIKWFKNIDKYELKEVFDKLQSSTYLTPDEYLEIGKRLSDLIGNNSVMNLTAIVTKLYEYSVPVVKIEKVEKKTNRRKRKEGGEEK